MYCLDTNICIDFLRGKDIQLRERLLQTDSGSIKLPSVVVAELMFGVERSRHPEFVKIKIRAFVKQFQILPFDENAANIYGKIRNNVATSGNNVGPNDLLIASIAIANGAILVTRNTQEFDRIEGLLTESWTL